MLEPVVAKVPVRRAVYAEFAGRIDPAPAGARVGLTPRASVSAVLDALDIVLAAALQRVFTAIKA